MRAVWACLGLSALAAALAACAGTGHGPDRAQAGEPALTQYGDCVIEQAQRMAASRESAETVAVAAVDACPEQLKALRALYLSLMGPGYADHFVAHDVRSEARRVALDAVTNARAGQPSPQRSSRGSIPPIFERPVQAWTSCLGDRTAKLSISSEPAATVAEAVFASCWEQEAALRDALTASYGAHAAERQIEHIRQSMKGHVEAGVIQTRQFLARRARPAPAAPPKDEGAI